jgi:sugar/nucleoside kinase (ribokinase family)
MCSNAKGMETIMVDVVVSGHICLDLLPDMGKVPLDRLASPGLLFEVDALDMSTGGAVSNTGLALHILGADVGLMGKIGGDLIGRLITVTLNELDPKLSQFVKVQDDERSSYTIVLSPENSDRIFLHCTGTNDTFGIDDIDFETVSSARIFHMGYPPLLPRMMQNDGAELVEIYRRAKAAGVITSLDTAQPDPTKLSGRVDWRGILSKAMPDVDIFIPSIEEIVFMLRHDDYERWGGSVLANIDGDYIRDLADEMLGLGVAVTGFKLSRYGFYLHVTDDAERLKALAALPIDLEAWRGARAYHPAFVVNVVGTTGAGDASYGAVLAAMLRGLSPVEAVEMACAVGACNVESASATGGLRPWDETAARVRSGWDVSATSLPGL